MPGFGRSGPACDGRVLRLAHTIQRLDERRIAKVATELGEDVERLVRVVEINMDKFSRAYGCPEPNVGH
jgi:hypothetical protein